MLRHYLLRSLLAVTTVTKECGMAPRKRQYARTASEPAEIADVGQMGNQECRPAAPLHNAAKVFLPALVMGGVTHVKKEAPASAGAVVVRNPALRLNDARSDKEYQLLRIGRDGAMAEQVAEDRNVAEQRNLRNVDRVLRLDNAADNHGAAIGHQNLRGGLLRYQSRVALDGPAEVRRSVFHVHVQEDSVHRRDLRGDAKPQEGVHIGYGRRAA